MFRARPYGPTRGRGVRDEPTWPFRVSCSLLLLQ
jgi:hypothetical protein